MLIIGIETSSPHGGVALLEDERLLGVQMVASSRAHSRLILKTLESLLSETSRALEMVDGVAVSVGPGSFTGVRVGLSLAKALCLEGKPALAAVSSLEALAWKAYGGEMVEYVVPLLNAMQGEVYGAVFRVADARTLVRVEEDFVCRPEELAQRWPGRCLIAGEGAVAYLDLWEGLGDDFALMARVDRRHPGPETVAVLGHERLLNGETVSAEALAPRYLREAATSKPKPRNFGTGAK